MYAPPKVLAILVLLFGLCLRVGATDTEVSEIEFFESKVRPVLVNHCYRCHSAEAAEAGKLKGEFRLDTRDALRKGGVNGPVIVPGKPDESRLVLSVRYSSELKMPPNGKLPVRAVETLEKWVTMGAPDPRPLSPMGPITAKPLIDFDTERKQWAFTRPVKHPLPKVSDRSWPLQPIDFFLRAAMEQRQLRPVRPATKRELIRRATFDLIGLPPTPEECEEFERDTAQDAYAKVIGRLLDSPHYGERWGRYWLDLARYADDQGDAFLKPAPTAYLYRDWVIDAFNRNMPYDEFVRLQIAGDEMPGSTADYIGRLAGLGFQGLGPQFRKDAANGEAKAKADELDDRIDTVSRGLLGLTVACARCHDHKFDPIPTRDYYSLAAAYNGAAWSDRMLASPETIAAHKRWNDQLQQQKSNLKNWLNDQIRRLRQQALESIDAYSTAAYKVLVSRQLKWDLDETNIARHEGLQIYYLRRWIEQLERSNVDPCLKSFSAAVRKSIVDATAEIPDYLQQEIETLKSNALTALSVSAAHEKPNNSAGKPMSPSAEQQELIRVLWKDDKAAFFVSEKDLPDLLGESERAHHAMLQSDLSKLLAAVPQTGPVMPSVSGGGKAMQVFVRGDPEKQGEPASPGFLQILSEPGKKDIEPSFTRLDLAHAIASPKNPLTARVFVNRVWHYHFGKGIVSTLSNFGKLGSPPTHPELLDTLAVRFMEAGWSVKWLHREIMLSAVYQTSSADDADNFAADPNNDYLWRMTPKRLDIEAWRDAVLAVAGKLDPKVGGPTLDQANPGLKETADMSTFSRLNGLEIDNPQNRRRTIYGIISRYAPNTTLTLFDFPEPNVTSDQRGFTTIPQQQLFVLNSAFVTEMSREFANRIQNGASDDEQRLRLAWQLAYVRLPTEAEIIIARKFLREPRISNPADKIGRWQQLAHAILLCNEFMFVH